MRKRPRLLIFGIDGADPRIINHGIKNGYLPNLASLSKDSVFKDLRCTWPPHTATGWSSIFSGCLPGEHGIFQFWNCQNREYKLEPTHSAEIGVPQIWDVFQSLGWTMALINIPMTHPPGPWAGYQLTWPLIKTLHYSKPPSLAKELSAVGGLGLPDLALMYNEHSGYFERAKQLIRLRTNGVSYLIKNKPIDVFAVVYPEVDRMSHHFWQEIDSSSTGGSHSTSDKGTAIQKIYEEIDRALGELMDLVGEDCDILVVSDHGFGPCNKGIRLHNFLDKLGFLKISHPFRDREPTGLVETTAKYNSLDSLNWDKTLAYVPTPGCFGLNLNLKGRQIKGVVNSKDRNTIILELQAAIMEIKEPGSNKKIFKQIVRSEQCYPGKFSYRAPDLLLVPADPATSILSGINGNLWDNPSQSGLHRIEGICMFRSKQRSSILSEEIIAIENVAPILLELLGIQSEKFLPKYNNLEHYGLERHSWSNQKDQKLSLCAPSENCSYLESHDNVELQDEESKTDEIVLKRLRDLGYLD